MPYLRLPEVKLHYMQMGRDHHPVSDNLVMIHGLAANLAFWYLRIAPAFTSDFAVTLFDLRGHGHSGRPPQGYTPAAMAEDLRQMADQLGLERFSILAHSFGGLVALHFVRAFPERVDRLILADTHLGAFRKHQRVKDLGRGRELRAALAAEGIVIDPNETHFGFRLLEKVARLHVDSPERARRFEGRLSPFLGRSARHGAQRWIDLLETTSAGTEIYREDGLTLPALRSIHVPTLGVYGERSHALASGRALATIWPQCQLEIVPNAGHFFPLSMPDSLIHACLPFLREGHQNDNVRLAP
jgi:pimeloyl-ACP methyl ester carboxylesterase